MNYGRRIRSGRNGDVLWCELSDHEVLDVLLANIRLNAAIYQKCLGEALERMNVASENAETVLATNPRVQHEAQTIAAALYKQCAVKSFVALQAALDRRVHDEKCRS